MITHTSTKSSSTLLIRVPPPKAVIVYLYYAFVFSIPFEAVDYGLEGLTSSRLIGFMLIAASLLQPKVCFAAPPKAFWCFATYSFVYVLLMCTSALSVAQEAGVTTLALSQLKTLVQLLVLFWIAYNLMRFERVSKGVLLLIATSNVLVGILEALGLTANDIEGDRVSAFGVNPNALATTLSLGLLALISLAYGRKDMDRKFRLLAWLSFAVLTIAIVRTGSRGNMLALFPAFLALVIKPGDVWRNIKAGVMVFGIVSCLVGASYVIETVRERWEMTYFEGDTAGRENIYPAAWEMFLEKPLLGWGPVENYRELGARRGKPALDPHNLYLWLLTEGGLLGAVPFFLGLGLCFRAAWRARNTLQGALPLAMLLYLLAVNAKGTGFSDKLFWVVLAYIVASGSFMVRHQWLGRLKIRSPIARLGPSQSTANRAQTDGV